MITWIGTLWLRSKLSVYMISAACLTLVIFLAAWRRSSRKRAEAEARVEALEQVRQTESRISRKRTELREKARLVREQIEASKVRDYFQGGWGP